MNTTIEIQMDATKAAVIEAHAEACRTLQRARGYSDDWTAGCLTFTVNDLLEGTPWAGLVDEVVNRFVEAPDDGLRTIVEGVFNEELEFNDDLKVMLGGNVQLRILWV